MVLAIIESMLRGLEYINDKKEAAHAKKSTKYQRAG